MNGGSDRLRFGPFVIDLRTREVWKDGARMKLLGQPFEILAVLVTHPGEPLTREELRTRLWPQDTFVDFDHGMNAAVNKLREALNDSADNPTYIETLPRLGYRFIAPVTRVALDARDRGAAPARPWWKLVALTASVFLLAWMGAYLIRSRPIRSLKKALALTRLTFDEGLQSGVSWSPDSRFIAYSSDRGGKFDIWVGQVSGGDPVQITKGPGQNWQPSWSPDGKYIAYRSESRGGGLFVIPALGGEGLERRVADFGYQPRWSPDSSQILFRGSGFLGENRFYLVSLDGSRPHEVSRDLNGLRATVSEVAWHPDGRITMWVDGPEAAAGFWIVPVGGGVAVKLDVPSEVSKQLEGSALPGIVEWTREFAFAWAPSGRAIYFPQKFRGAVNLWKMEVDPKKLRATAVERVTTGTGPDAELAPSPDGKKLAFTGQSQHIQAWHFPFDGNGGLLTGDGKAITQPGMATWRFDLSRDGKKLAFVGSRGGRSQLWETSLVSSQMSRIAADDYLRDSPHWSPDGKRLVSYRYDFTTHDVGWVLWSPETRNEGLIPNSSLIDVTDWSPDSKSLLVSRWNEEIKHTEIWLLPVSAADSAEPAERRLVSEVASDLGDAKFSSDGRWIVFQSTRNLPSGSESRLYVTLTSGGPWIPLTDGKYWDGRPHWSPNGKIIYFVSDRSSFYSNIWGIHFDPAQGKPKGSAFAVTNFESPALMVPWHTPSVQFSLTQDHLVLTMEQVSGSIWMLENMDQ